MKKIRVLWLTALFLWVLATLGSAAEVTVTGQGASERDALHDAMRTAIEQEVGVLVDSHTYVKNYQLIHDAIYTHSEGYISRYEVMEKNYANGIHTVTIRAEVSAELLQTDLLTKLEKQALIRANLLDPRLGVIMIDKASGKEDMSLENTIIASLQENGFSRLVDLKQVDAAVRKRIATAAFEGDEALAAMLKNTFPVDYLVTGEADISRLDGSPAWGGIVSSGAEVTLAVRLLNVNTGEIAYAGSFTARSPLTANRATGIALRKASRDLVKALSRGALAKAANPRQHVTLVVTDGTLGNMTEAYSFLGRLPGVSGVYPRAQEGGQQAFDIDYDGTAFDLAQTLEREGATVRETSSEYIRI